MIDFSQGRWPRGPRRELVGLRHIAGVFLALSAIGLTAATPMFGIAVVAALVMAGLYISGSSQISGVVLYLLLLYFVSPRLAFGIYEITPALLVGLGCLLLWLGGRASLVGTRHLTSPMTVVVTGYFCVILLTYALGLRHPLLFEQLRGADRSLVKLLALVGVVLLVIDVVDTRRRLRQVLGVIVAGGAFVAFTPVLQSFTGYDLVGELGLPGLTDRGVLHTGLKLRLGLQRTTGTARHPIELGTTCAIVLPLAFHFLAHGRTARVRAGSAVTVGLLVLSLLVSLSRSAYVGLAVVLIMLLPRWSSQRRFRFGLIALPAVVALVALAPQAFDAAVQLVVNYTGEDIAGARVSARTEDWDVVRGLVAERPWFGQGFGTFVGSTAFAADNQFLTSLVETGLVGIAALLTLMATAYMLARRAYRHAGAPDDRDLAASVAASVAVAIISFGMFDAMAFDLTVASAFVVFGIAGTLPIVLREHVADVDAAVNGSTETEPASVPADVTVPVARSAVSDRV